MRTPDEYITEVSNDLLEGKVAFMAGAGISIGRNSWLPDWSGLVLSLLKIAAGPNRKFEISYIKKNYMQLLFNEVFLHLMAKSLGPAVVLDAIRKCMNITEYNLVHKFLAWSMLYSDSVVLTTNYDELIERAGDFRIKPFKLHGTLSEPKSMRFTIKQIFSPLNEAQVSKISPELNGRTLVVVGYRGADEFDVIPFLFGQTELHKIIWITHGNPEQDLDPHTKKRLDKSGFPYFKYNSDDFLKSVYERTKHSLQCDDELDQWLIAQKGKTEGWWKKELATWGKQVNQTKRSDMEFLWAQILDYLRIYKLERKGGEIRRPAEEAYNLFLELNPGNIRELEAQLQLAYIERITRTDESDDAKAELIKTFHNLINIIKIKLETNETERAELTKLLARAYHELAIALQNQDQYSDANTYFENAIDLRSSQNDPEVAYSIFQQFFNYRLAYRARKISNIDDLIPGWKDRLIIELQKNAMIFKDTSDPDHYSTTLHNLAFVHQFLAEESESAKRFEEAKNEYLRANRIYENAKITREKLRDPKKDRPKQCEDCRMQTWSSTIRIEDCI
jgi:tetratricopeptide (TPR) repeat protein